MSVIRKVDPERGERIKHVRLNVLQLRSQERFAKEIGNVSRGAVGNWELGKEISLENLKLIADVTGVSLNWLAYGEGQMKAGERPSIVSSFDPDGDDTSNGYSRDHWEPSFPGGIPEIDVKLGAGEGVVGEMINVRVGEDTHIGHKVLAEWMLNKDFVKHEAKASPRNTVVMEVIGDSMIPSYQPGDRVLVDMAQTRMLADTVYAISDGTSEPQIKRLQRIPFSDPVRVKIISDNPALETFEVDLDRLTIIGRVCGHIAKR